MLALSFPSLLYFLIIFLSYTKITTTVDAVKTRTATTIEEEQQQPQHNLIQTRIVGGSEVENGKHPYFVHIGVCGGSLIHGDIVLTAAHCIRPPGKIAQIGAQIRGSSTTTTTDDGNDDGSFYAAIIDQVVHPEFEDGNNEYDFLIIKLGGWMGGRKDVVPINTNFDFVQDDDDSLMTVMGFGMTEEDGDESDVLMETQVSLISGKDCSELYHMFNFQEDTMICALEKGKDR